MEMNGSRELAASREEVWKALLSSDILQACVPGCQEVTGSPDTGFEATVVQKVGPVKATFKGGVTLLDRVEGQSLTLDGAGKGGAAGFAKGIARVFLEDNGTGTVLRYEVEANVGGKLAQLGSRIIDGFAKKMADQFFERFQVALDGPAENISDAAQENTPDEEKKSSWIKRVWNRDAT